MIFHEASIGLTGSITAIEEINTADLRSEAVGVFLSLLDENHSAFVAPVPVRKFDHIQLQWCDYVSSAAATFLCRNEAVTKVLLLSGRSQDLDAVAFRVFQRLLSESVGHRSNIDDQITERPVLIAAAIANPRIDPEERRAVKVIQRFLAAAYFERLAATADTALAAWSRASSEAT